MGGAGVTSAVLLFAEQEAVSAGAGTIRADAIVVAVGRAAPLRALLAHPPHIALALTAAMLAARWHARATAVAVSRAGELIARRTAKAFLTHALAYAAIAAAGAVLRTRVLFAGFTSPPGRAHAAALNAFAMSLRCMAARGGAAGIMTRTGIDFARRRKKATLAATQAFVACRMATALGRICARLESGTVLVHIAVVARAFSRDEHASMSRARCSVPSYRKSVSSRRIEADGADKHAGHGSKVKASHPTSIFLEAAFGRPGFHSRLAGSLSCPTLARRLGCRLFTVLRSRWQI